MSWAAVGGAAVGVVGNMMTSDKKGGAGTTTASKEPWADAAPWLRDQIKTGQDLQSQYQQTPFNAQQLAAYGNMGRQTDYMNNLVPDLLGQVSNQRLGFDRANPMARPTPYTFNGSGLMAGSQQGGNQQAGAAPTGLLAQLANPATVADPSSGAQYTSAANPEPVAAPVVAPSPFTNFDQTAFIQNIGRDGFDTSKQGAGLGAFTYGMEAPQAGTQAYRDMQEYMQWGGADPFGRYSGTPIGQLQADSQRN